MYDQRNKLGTVGETLTENTFFGLQARNNNLLPVHLTYAPISGH